MSTSDPFNLERFVAAQAPVLSTVLAELKAGHKRSHWMWFIFPQIAGLGRSPMAQHYAIVALEEARAYLAHPVLGERLRQCVEALDGLTGTTARAVFGEVDAMKLRSSLTLFREAGADPLFGAALDRWFAGTSDAATLGLINRPS